MPGTDRPVSTASLLQVLAPLVERRLPGARISGISRSAAAYRSSWWLEDLSVRLDDGRVLEIVFKDLTRSTPGSFAHLAKPGHVLDARREPWVYASVFEPLRRRQSQGTRDRPGEGPPVYWGASSGCRTRWLFLERIHGTPLSEVGSPDVWRDAAAWLGRFHVVMESRSGPPGPLLRHRPEIHLEWLRRAESSVRGRSDSTARSARRWGLIRRSHASAVRELLCAPGVGTLIHGEFYPSNVLVEQRGRGRRIRPVDWEMAGVGPRLLDLAALTCGEWSLEDRAGMLLAYRGGMLDAGGKAEPMDRFMWKLAACRLLLAVQWLGWSKTWSPPPEHRRDWYLEAVRGAEEMEAA